MRNEANVESKAERSEKSNEQPSKSLMEAADSDLEDEKKTPAIQEDDVDDSTVVPKVGCNSVHRKD